MIVVHCLLLIWAEAHRKILHALLQLPCAGKGLTNTDKVVIELVQPNTVDVTE